MTDRLYTVDINGVEHAVNTTCAASELKPTAEYPPADEFCKALKGLQSVSVEVALPQEVCAELRKRHATWDALRSAMFKLRKSCRICRWNVLERNGMHKSKHGMHWYCKFKREQDTCLLWYNALTCEHFRRKCKSKP